MASLIARSSSTLSGMRARSSTLPSSLAFSARLHQVAEVVLDIFTLLLFVVFLLLFLLLPLLHQRERSRVVELIITEEPR
jgi:preprotein translocase subunit SecG